jgi:flagellar protein FliS
MNQYATVRRAYLEAAVMNATPQELIVMLYDGAIRYLRQAAGAYRDGRREVSREKVRQAQAVIDELNRSLDMRHGELPERLRSIYTFCTRHLIESTAASDPEGFDKVATMLADLRDSWATLAERERVVVAQSA